MDFAIRGGPRSGSSANGEGLLYDFQKNIYIRSSCLEKNIVSLLTVMWEEGGGSLG